ncbi:MAG: hypothetical protein ACD_28C00071G0001 [uncultured bacterium]|nr:MAG: hypothetical protein ACD_28C00071G0001 [uncultured bacterium]KKT77175.1 MAG: hypothetical protein UW70_C0002G0014 [Candidatus Peregrinibacteria bacterium GW2011_GWA2_44_7]
MSFHFQSESGTFEAGSDKVVPTYLKAALAILRNNEQLNEQRTYVMETFRAMTICQPDGEKKCEAFEGYLSRICSGELQYIPMAVSFFMESIPENYILYESVFNRFLEKIGFYEDAADVLFGQRGVIVERVKQALEGLLEEGVTFDFPNRSTEVVKTCLDKFVLGAVPHPSDPLGRTLSLSRLRFYSKPTPIHDHPLTLVEMVTCGQLREVELEKVGDEEGCVFRPRAIQLHEAGTFAEYDGRSQGELPYYHSVWSTPEVPYTETLNVYLGKTTSHNIRTFGGREFNVQRIHPEYREEVVSALARDGFV